MKRIVMAAAVVVAACSGPSNKPSAAADTTVALPASASAQPVDSVTSVGDKFDATIVKSGERVGSLEIAATDVQPAPKSPIGVSGSISYKGELQLSGQYRAHYEYPVKQEACFYPAAQEWKKLPRAKGDERAIWFCFSNKSQAIAQLGPLGKQADATIIVADYTTNLKTSDVWDSARLVRVIRKN